MNLVYALLVMMLLPARAGASTGGEVSARWRPETQLIVAAAAIGALTDLLSYGATLWISLQPHLFKRIGAGDWTTFGIVLLSARVVLHLAILAGAAAMLMRRDRRSGVARGLLLTGAAGLLALSVCGYVHSMFWPPVGMPRYQGAQLITTTVYGISSLITLGMIHALVLFAFARRRSNP
jgi:hypothetical protein